jgi:transposase
MPAPLSLDIRLRFQRCIEDGLSGRAAARRLMISPASGARLAKRIRAGAPITPAKCGRPTGWGKLGPCRDFLLEMVGQDPDITLRELQGALAEAEGVRVNETSLSRALHRLGFTYKKSRWSRTSTAGPMSPAPAETG